MRIKAPWKIHHIDLSKGAPAIGPEPGYRAAYLVFWWRDLPLGHTVVPTELLPMASSEVAVRAAQATAPAILHRVLAPMGGPAMAVVDLDAQVYSASDLDGMLSITDPLAALDEHTRTGVQLQHQRSIHKPTVSVVICTRDRPGTLLARCLASLQALSPRPHEIVVVDNAPNSDETRRLVEGMDGVRYVLEPRPGLSAARNCGIRHSTGEIVAFTDDDVTVHPNWLQALCRGFDDPQVMVITGLVLPQELETEAQLTFELDHGFCRGQYGALTFGPDFFAETKNRGAPVWLLGAGASMAIRRKAFDLVGGFDERLGPGAAGVADDSEMWYRLLAEGWLGRYEPTAVVYHTHRRALSGLHSQMHQYMRGHTAALLAQFDRYHHWGNLVRAFIILPAYFGRVFAGALIHGFGARYSTFWTEVTGHFAGIAYYLRHRQDGMPVYGDLQNAVSLDLPGERKAHS